MGYPFHFLLLELFDFFFFLPFFLWTLLLNLYKNSIFHESFIDFFIVAFFIYQPIGLVRIFDSEPEVDQRRMQSADNNACEFPIKGDRNESREAAHHFADLERLGLHLFEVAALGKHFLLHYICIADRFLEPLLRWACVVKVNFQKEFCLKVSLIDVNF